MLAKFWKKLDGNKVKCELCPRKCVLREEQDGFCRTRGNRKGDMEELLDHQLHAIAIDPVEKKPLYHFCPGSRVLSVGTIGCNLSCKCCQNWNLSASDMRSGERIAPAELVDLALKHECEGIAYTYNEPIIFAEYVMASAKLAKKAGLKNIMVSAGYITESARSEVFENIDAVNIDLKSFASERHLKHTGANLDSILDTIIFLKDRVWLELTTLVIPGFNDSTKEMSALIDWVVENLGTGVPLHFSAFHPDHEMLDRGCTSVEKLKEIRTLAEAAGIEHVHLGNIN